jgi:hypothetical protein
MPVLGKSDIRVPRIVKTAVVLCAILFFSAAFAPAFASITMTFEGLQNLEEVLNYYNGGLGSQGSGPGPNYGVVFGSDALALIDSASGGTGNTANDPSGDTVAIFLSGGAVVMNVAAGFTTGFSFYYSAPGYTGSVTVYDGLNGSGNVLATLPLPLTGGYCNSSKTYSCWNPIGVTFSGTAKSVSFGGTANFIAFDNITIGSATPGGAATGPSVPALSGWGVVALAILLVVAAAGLLRAAAARTRLPAWIYRRGRRGPRNRSPPPVMLQSLRCAGSCFGHFC